MLSLFKQVAPIIGIFNMRMPSPADSMRSVCNERSKKYTCIISTVSGFFLHIYMLLPFNQKIENTTVTLSFRTHEVVDINTIADPRTDFQTLQT